MDQEIENDARVGPMGGKLDIGLRGTMLSGCS